MLPDAMIDPVCAVLAGAPGVGSAYLSGHDRQRRGPQLPAGAGRSRRTRSCSPPWRRRPARTWLSREKKMDLNITTSISPLGQQGMQGSEPFDRKGIGRVIEEDDDE